MFPIAIIAGVIGAVVSRAEGATWASQHLGSSKSSSVGSKTAASVEADAKATPSFEATLAAQVTGQSVPTSTTSALSATSTVAATQQLTDYDTLARTQAGIAAYTQVGEHHNSHAGSKSDASDVSPLIRS
jgi:hypothetical protein